MSGSWVPEAHGTSVERLQSRVVRGLTWTVVDTWGRLLLNLVIFVLLARLLSPADFGLVALAAVFVSLAQLLVDQGLGDALIQRRELTRSHVDTAFWVALATGAILTMATLLVASPIATLLNEPDLAPVLQVLSVTFILAAMDSIQIALLRRQFAFRSLALRSLAASAGGGVAGVAMAVAGYGAWSLVGQQITAAALSVLALWTVSPWRPGFRLSLTQFRELFAFGISVVASDMLNFVSRNADNLLIGTFLGTRPLGFYAVAYRILDVSQAVLVNVGRKITFPAFARIQADADRLRRGYLQVIRVGGTLILPGFLGLAAVATELVVIVFGGRWAASGPVAAVLFCAGPMLAVQAFSAALLNAVGYPGVVFRLRLISAVANVIGFLVAVQFGIVAVAFAFVVRGYLLMPLTLYWSRTYAGIAIGSFLQQVRYSGIATASMLLVVLAAKMLLSGALRPVELLVAEVITGLLIYGAVMLVLQPSQLQELLTVARQAVAQSGKGGRAASDADPAEAPDA